MVTINPSEVKVSYLHQLLLAAVAPRPICFASTIDKDGNPNLSPFSFFNVFSANPPVAIFSPAISGRTGLTKHTLDNIREVPEVVINIVNYDMVEQMSLASSEYPKGVNEFLKSGFTMEPSELIRPYRVKESPVQFECTIREVMELGKEGGAGNLVICDIKKIHIRREVMTGDKIDQKKIKLIARLGGDWYCKAFGDALFEVAKPLTTIGIGVDSLPEKIRNSKILTGNNLGKLANIECIPSNEEVQEYIKHGSILELFEDFKNNKEKLHEELHIIARNLLETEKVNEAWCVLMASI